MPGSNRNRWTNDQFNLMLQLRAGGIDFDTVAVRVGHPVSSCKSTMSAHLAAMRRRMAQKERHELREAADRVAGFDPKAAARPKAKPKPQPLRAFAAPKPPEPTDYARSSISTAALRMDSELRARIEIMGVTGGLLGDPLPGRSALDRRKSQGAGR